MSKDDRSDIESSSDEDDSPPPNQKHHNSATNGTNKSHGTNGYLTGAPYPDEHWLRWYLNTGAMLQTPSISLCVCVRVCIWVYVEDLNNITCLVLEVLSRFKWMQFWYRFDSLLISSRSLVIFIYIFASNCTQWVIKALLSVQPTLCLANERIPLYGVSMLL